MDARLPRRLSTHDLIGIIAPASPVEDESKTEQGIRYLEGLGYRTVIGKHVRERTGYLAGSDDARAEDIHAMFANRRVKAVFCLRGGYGSPRLLSRLDYRLVARNPKIFVGYSDITALHLAFWSKSRLVTFHGPMLAVDMAGGMDPLAEESFWRTLTSGEDCLPLLRWEPAASRTKAVSGTLLGGNLSLLVSLLGTPFQPDFGKSIVFLEETGEEPYRIDRMMTQMRNAGIFRRAGGVALGAFTNCAARVSFPRTFTVDEIMQNMALMTGKPFIAGLPFGHMPGTVTLPVGIRASFDLEKGSAKSLGQAVH